MHRLPRIALTSLEPQLQLPAQELANTYHFPYIEITEQKNFDFILLLTKIGLMLQQPGNQEANLQIDFLSGKLAYRLRHARHQKQLLAKAIGLQARPSIKVLDLTAGLGQDGFILAQLGFSVTLLERSPIISMLLNDALQRALKHINYAHITIQLITIDAAHYLQHIKPRMQLPDIIYLDPMYPPANKSALAKKEMRILREIVGHDPDAETLFPLALACAKKRVIVKRPRLAAFFAKQKPHHSIMGKQHRFDVYLVKNSD